MNLVSTLLGLSVMGIAAPTVLDMSIAPLIAQKRAINFGSAESAAVVFAAANQGATQVGNPPDGCQLDNGTNAPAREITCTHGRSKFAQTVSRSFMLATAKQGSSARSFSHLTPTRFSGHQCPTTDRWGVMGYNNRMAQNMGGACIPQVAWTKNSYENSNPDNWVYDINNWNGWGANSTY
jgi:hypothetical protein